MWRHSNRVTTILVAALVVALAGCGLTADLPDPDAPVIPAVGAVDTECGPTVLMDGPGDAADMRSGSECFLAEVDAGRGTVWDVVSTMPDGDVVIRRFDFDGKFVWITVDSTRARPGDRAVVVWRCQAIEPIADGLPEGSECSESAGEPLEIIDGLIPQG